MEGFSKKQIFLADMGLLAVALIWGVGFIAGKFALYGFSTFYILAFRFLGAVVIMLLLFPYKIKAINRVALKYGLIIGIVQFLSQYAQVKGLIYTTPGKQAFIAPSYAIFVPFIAWLIRKERPSIRVVGCALIMFLGIALLSVGNDFSVNKGDVYSVIFAFMFGVEIVLVGIFNREVDSIVLTFLLFLFVGIISLVLALFSQAPEFNLSVYSVGGLLYLIVINTGVAFTLQTVCQRFTPASHTSLLLATESLFGFIASALIIGESLTPRAFLGCVLIITAILVSKMEGIGLGKRKLRKNIEGDKGGGD